MAPFCPGPLHVRRRRSSADLPEPYCRVVPLSREETIRHPRTSQRSSSTVINSRCEPPPWQQSPARAWRVLGTITWLAGRHRERTNVKPTLTTFQPDGACQPASFHNAVAFDVLQNFALSSVPLRPIGTRVDGIVQRRAERGKSERM